VPCGESSPTLPAAISAPSPVLLSGPAVITSEGASPYPARRKRSCSTRSICGESTINCAPSIRLIEDDSSVQLQGSPAVNLLGLCCDWRLLSRVTLG